MAKMGLMVVKQFSWIGYIETSISKYQTTLRRVPEQLRSNWHCGQELKLRVMDIYCNNCTKHVNAVCVCVCLCVCVCVCVCSMKSC
jgi:hypothetical protein